MATGMSATANLYALTCVVLGLALIGYSIYQRRRIQASERWQTVTGTITRAEVVENKASDSREYNLAVSYAYAVNGSHYVGSRIEFGQRRAYLRKKTAEAQAARYPVNSSVMVYFNPEKPEDAVLNREATYVTGYLVMGILALVLGLGIVLHSVISG
jgi:hypothetical protein